ncbi:MAG: ATP-grasp domain-containing protein [Patescibacteria group bacterium]|nr:ATP-grasp domain-containing protein [Patescibacteria group bacterium]
MSSKQTLVLLHDSFVSQILVDTLRDFNVPTYTEGNLRILLQRQGLDIIGTEQLTPLLAGGDTAVYFNAEDCLQWIEQYGGTGKLLSDIAFFKDKFGFKKAIANAYPDYFIQDLTTDQLDSFRVPVGKDLIVKPSIGFHSVGIRRFSTQPQWDIVKKDIVDEVKRYSKVFDQNVLNTSRFMVEEYLHGEEYACDAYFDANGTPVICSISHHPFADENDTRDLVYYTSAQLMREKLPPLQAFLELVANKRTLKNFPVHFEVRFVNGKVYPIEVNPLRFGGFGLADLPQHAFKSNSYRHFIEGTKPDWDSLLSQSDNRYYAFVVGQTPENFNAKTEGIDVNAYKRTFKEILGYIPTDASKYKFFSTTFTASDKLKDLTKYLTFDFGQLRKNK